jgi:hypothetical protein
MQLLELIAKIRKSAPIAMAMSYYKKEAVSLLKKTPMSSKNTKRFEKTLIDYRGITGKPQTFIEQWPTKQKQIKTLFASRYGIALSDEMLDELKAVIQNA